MIRANDPFAVPFDGRPGGCYGNNFRPRNRVVGAFYTPEASRVIRLSSGYLGDAGKEVAWLS
jgi:hypothetical protein